MILQDDYSSFKYKYVLNLKINPNIELTVTGCYNQKNMVGLLQCYSMLLNYQLYTYYMYYYNILLNRYNLI